MFHWLKDATAFAKRHRDELVQRPVWLFSSGPLGINRADAEGNDVLEASRPREFDELTDLLRPRGEREFFGAFRPRSAADRLTERLVRHLPAARDATPAGDFRDWSVIDACAAEIAAELQTNKAKPQ
jgi:menaquinone-dependent protoporphyrinogen oxidase